MGQLAQELQGFVMPSSSFVIFVQVYQKKKQLKRILLVDNYDSFTYNLVHYLESLDCEVNVCFNDAIPANILGSFDGVVLSPGPGLPEQSGQLMSFLKNNIGAVPILGVCLGMQALALQSGGTLFNQKIVKHGVQEEIEVLESALFSQNDSAYQVGLYHSWAVSEGDYRVTARTRDGVIMAMENEVKRFYAVQFHPESIMTPKGKEVLSNFLKKIPELAVISAV
ncbi:MAG: aminodeoxychorismate/anthranilate synthase component II [Crocinitomicaceae bacterium]